MPPSRPRLTAPGPPGDRVASPITRAAIRSLAACAGAGLVLALAGCVSTSAGFSGHGVRVAAAENVWGSIARQLGGRHASVRSIIDNPAQDPHNYEPGAADARTMATAQLAIVNGVAYDPWAPKLLDANPVDGRVTLSVGRLLHLRAGDNPHRWYDPTEVEQTAAAITADLEHLDPSHSAYFAARLRQFDTGGLATYHRLIRAIRATYARVPVGASESIFALLAPALGLRLITPPGFLRAISEGTELTASELTTAERQLSDRRVKVWVENSQNVTPEIERLNALARRRGIPIATVTETLSPATSSFPRWQVAQLNRLRAALASATRR